MSHYGGPVPWHRVVNASGRVVPGHEQEALRRLRAEGTPLRGDRVNLKVALWWPED
jgi:alkylated DNA nucleotide flippase Atl1